MTVIDAYPLVRWVHMALVATSATLFVVRGGRAEQNGLIREADVAGVGIGFGIDGDGADAHAAGGLDDPTGDLAAVCNKDLVKHGLGPNPGG